MRDDIRSGPRLFALIGAGLAVISTLIPWFKTANLSEVNRITPATVPYLRGSVWLLSILLIVGAVLLAVKGTPILLGCVGALWFNVCLVVWILGSKTSSILPKALLPDNFTVRLQLGADIGLVAALLIVMSCVMVLADQTWEGSQQLVRGWPVPVGVVVAVLLIGVREATWIRLDAPSFGWNLTVDAVPVLGDLLLVLLFIGALAAIATAFAERVWLMITCIVIGSLTAILSLIGLLFDSVIMDVAKWISHQTPFLKDQSVHLSNKFGAFFTLFAGAALGAYGVALLLYRIHGTGPSTKSSTTEAWASEPTPEPW